MTNTLYYGDNLPILKKYIPDESVDLIYLDPPFNSNRNYNVLFKDESGSESEAQITAFEDSWHWTGETEKLYHEIVTASLPVSGLIDSLHSVIKTNQMMAYLVMMTARLIELHRVLKPTGSLYLHCDPTASHYLKIVLDAIFGGANFKNEIVWKRTSAHNDPGRFGANIDILLFYAKSDHWKWNQIYLPHPEEYRARFKHKDSDGRLWSDYDLSAKGLSGGGYEYEYRGIKSLWRCPIETMQKFDSEGKLHFTCKGGIRLKRYLDENKGYAIQALWDDISPINSQAAERLGYPTQKPLTLLERIISASSNRGDVVLDPFCGCGTAIVAAQKLGRQWIGIDITHLSIALLKYRLKGSPFYLEQKKGYTVIGEPEDLSAAHQLAQDNRYQFQWWACSMINAFPLGGENKKGADKGVDGIITFIDDRSNKGKRAIVQVKSGHVKSGDIRDLKGVVEREKAVIGVFITLEQPTRPMLTEAATSGFYHSDGYEKDYPKIQILTIEQLQNGEQVKLPPDLSTFKKAAEKPVLDSQGRLF